MSNNEVMLENELQRALDRITSIKVHIHRCSLYGDEQAKKEIYDSYHTEAVNVRIPNKVGWFKKKCRIDTGFGYFYLYYSGRPGCYVTTAHTNSKLIRALSDLTPSLKPSQVEFAVDLMVDDYEDVGNLFYFIRRNIYFPARKGKIRTLGEFYGLHDSPETNRVFKAYRRTRRLGEKVYERGPDWAKMKAEDDIPAWTRETLDRVRVEITLKRTDKIAGENVLRSLEHMQTDPKLEQVMQRFIQFKCFKVTKSLPGEFGDYLVEDNSGRDQCFMAERRHADKLLENVSQYCKAAPSMQKLRERILAAAILTDQKWREGRAFSVQ
jgi:hypothetical protein